MAIDQRDVSSTLRFMDDRALQQYAAMHKSDPYIFPLAFQESQNRQRVRMSQQTAQGVQPQPKVNEQALAQMAPQPMPEAQGIGALPVGNMETMADGGIAGYPDDDFVTRNQSVVMMAEGGVARYQAGGSVAARYRQESQEMVSGNRVQYSPDVAAYAQQLSAEESAARNTAENAYLKTEQQRMLQGPYAAPTAAPQATMPEAGYTRGGFEGDPRLNTPPTQPVVAAPKVDTERKDTGRKDTGRKDTGRKDTGRKATAASEDPASAGLAGIKDPAKLYQDILAKQDYKDPASGALLELEAQERANAAAERQAVVADAERFKDAYKGREGRLAEREADIGKQKGQNTGLALLNAGLAIMSTPGGLATAIGKGAQVGTAQFASGLDKIRSAQERLGEARDRLDDMKLNREETTAKELRAAERNYRDVATNAQKRTIDGIRTAAGVNRADAKTIYDKTVDLTKTVYEQGEQTKRTRMQVDASNRNNPLDMVKALQGDPKLMATYRAMQGKNEDVMGQYNDFLKANPALALDQKAAFTQFLMTKAAFQQLGTPTVTDKPTGPVRN
jgi:hypothetical protein